VITISLTWQESAGTAVGLAGVSAALLYRGGVLGPRRGGTPGSGSAPAASRVGQTRAERRLAGAGRFVRESALFFALFSLWQYAGSFELLGTNGATGRGLWIWRAERAIRLPSEAALQRLFLPHPLLIQGLNLYYDILHFPVLLACLIWLFVRHRDRYGAFRTTLVAFTGASLLIQLIPVAPPRLLPATGMVDTALRYGQSVYPGPGGAGGGFDADQLSAMPSVHVGWAILVAIGVIAAARTRWRWLIIAYPVLTTLAVVVTANHYWADGLVAGLLLAVVLGTQSATRKALGTPSGQQAMTDQEAGEPQEAVTALRARAQAAAPQARFRRSARPAGLPAPRAATTAPRDRPA
jgi:PAP2 superfamily